MLVDWERYINIPSNLGITIEEVNPISNSGSLMFYHTGTMSYSRANVIPVEDSIGGLARGIYPSGKMRTICQVDQHDGSTGQISYFGIVAMQSQSSLISGSGSCYALLVVIEENLNNPMLHLHKFTYGLTNGLTVTSLASIPYPGSINIGVPFTLELQWLVDIPILGGVFLVGNTGIETDFSDLTGQITATDVVSPLTTSVAEGLVGSFKSNVNNSVKKVLFDNTTLFELV